MLSDISYQTMFAFMPIFLDSVDAKITSDMQLYYTIMIQQFVGILGTLLAAYLVETSLGRK